MLDHETIRSFIKVAECQSFSRAAELLHKTTATISYRIKTLEESIGTQLFIRTTRTVNLTPAGEYLLERCRQWHTWLDAMPGELRQINDGVEHQVNIVINNLLYDAAAVAGLLTHLHDKYPFTQFHISRQVYMGVWDALLNEDCHLAIGAAGNESLENSIKVLPLGKIEWVFAIAPTHPLAAAADPLNETQLRLTRRSTSKIPRAIWPSAPPGCCRASKRSKCRTCAPSWSVTCAVSGSVSFRASCAKLTLIAASWWLSSSNIRASPLPCRWPGPMLAAVRRCVP